MLKITKNQGSIQVTADKSGFYPFDGTITFPTNSLFTATSANTDMITFKSTSNGDVQFVGNYKDITISGRSYDTKQKFLTAFSNLANQSGVDAYTKAETDAKLNDKLTAQTNAKDALFISSSSNDDADSSVALYNSNVKGSNDVAIGWASTSSKEGMHNLAILNDAQASGSQNIAIGNNRRCDGLNNIGIGCGKTLTVDVLGSGNVCIGDNSQAHTDNNNAVNESIAIGSTAKASNDYCTVIGPNASSYGSHTVAIGKDAHADSVASWSVAVGDSARAHGERSVALGYLSYATNEIPLDICCGKRADNSPLRVLQSDANGKISLLKGDGTDERIVIQDEIEALKNAGGSGGTVDAYTKAETDAKIDAKQDKLTAGSGITITKDETAGTSTIATAVSLTDNGNGAYQVGDSIKMGSDTVVIGKSAISRSKTSIAIGKSATSGSGGSNVAIGNIANSSGGSSIAIGNKTETSNINTIAIGTLAGAYIPKSIAIGYNAKTSTNIPMVINAGGKTMFQGDANGKISLLKGDGTDERMVIQDEIAALKNAGGGTVDAYTKSETDTKLEAKQDKLTAGTGITITKDETAGTSTIATAVSLTDNGNGAYTVGDSIKIGNDITIGKNASGHNYSVAVGSNAMTTESFCAVIGQFATSYSGYGVAVGSSASINKDSDFCVAIGYNAQASNHNSVAIGNFANANKDNPLVINAGYKTVDGIRQRLTVLQSDSTGKLSVLKGDGTDERMVIQDEIAALKAEIAALKGGASTGDTTGA